MRTKFDTENGQTPITLHKLQESESLLINKLTSHTPHHILSLAILPGQYNLECQLLKMPVMKTKYIYIYKKA